MLDTSANRKRVSSALIGQHNKQGLFCGSLRRLSCYRVLNLFSFVLCAKTRGFFQKKWIESHDGGSEIFGGLHPFLKKKVSR